MTDKNGSSARPACHTCSMHLDRMQIYASVFGKVYTALAALALTQLESVKYLR